MSLQQNKPRIQGNLLKIFMCSCTREMSHIFLFSFLLRSFSFFVFICPPERQLRRWLHREAAFSFPFSGNQTSAESSSLTNTTFILRKCKKQLCLLKSYYFNFSHKGACHLQQFEISFSRNPYLIC